MNANFGLLQSAELHVSLGARHILWVNEGINLNIDLSWSQSRHCDKKAVML